MWRLWQKAKTYSQLPSTVLGETDGFAAWMLDNAVTWFGITIENALEERVKVGAEYQPKYSLARLLSPGFKIPPPPRETPEEVKLAENPWAPFLTWAGKPGSGVHRWVYVPPPVEKEQ